MSTSRLPAVGRCALALLLLAAAPGAPRTVARLAAGLGSPLGAQAVVVDEGTFSLTTRGERAGREDFSIRRTTTADRGYIAQGNLLRGEGRTAVALTTDSVGTPLRFAYERFVGGRPVENVSGELRGGLWSGRAVREGTESGREFRLPEVVIGADAGIIHETWFLVQFGRRPGVRLLEPRTLRLRSVVVEAAGADTVTIGFASIPARRWLVRNGGGGSIEREAWVDSRGRLLRVLLPAEGLEALRDEAPPETDPPS